MFAANLGKPSFRADPAGVPSTSNVLLAGGFATSGVTTWTPASMTGIQGWWRADKGVTLNGSNVSAWGSQEGNGYSAVQATVGLQPAFSSTAGKNGQATITFVSATTGPLAAAGFPTLTAPFEWFVVAQLSGTVANSGAYLFDLGGGNVYAAYVGTSITNLQVNNGGGSGPIVAMAGADDHLIDCVCNGNTSTTLSKDNGTAASGAASGTHTATGGISIGQHYTATGLTWNGRISEVVVLNALALAAEKPVLMNYFQGRYGISIVG